MCGHRVFGLVIVVGAVSWMVSSGEGDPAPGRSPGPPGPQGVPALSVAVGVDDKHQLTVQMPEDDELSSCDLHGDLIVVDKDKAPFNLTFFHEIFETNILTAGIIYQVSVARKLQDSTVIQGFSLHSLADGVPRGRFSTFGEKSNGRCMKSSVREEGGGPRIYNWTLPFEPRTHSNVTFRLRYKISSSSSVFQVNYVFAVSQGCQLWLKLEAANITSLDIPRSNDCQLFFPGHRSGHGLVLELTRLNVPCNAGGYLQFSGGSGSSPHLPQRVHQPSQSPRLCGKLEEIPDQERRFYFPSVRERVPALRLRGDPVFALNYRLVDYCYNVTFVTRNGTFDLIPSGDLQCTFKIYMPYGYRVLLKIEIGDFSQRVATTGLSQSHHPTESAACRGLLVELWDGSSSWSHCAMKGDSLRNIEIESTDNKVVMKVSVKGILAVSPAANSPGVGLRFRYRAEPIGEVVKQCSFGWVAVRQFCVTAVENIRMSWHQAEMECNRRGGHLASIRSSQAQHIIDNLLINSPGYRDQNAYWLGASDNTYEGDFRWSDGLPFSYANWFPGWPQDNYYNRQPNDDGFSEQDCVEARRAYHLPSEAVRLADGFMWNDRDCNTANYFLCERHIADEPVDDDWPPECNRTVILTREQPRDSVFSPGFPRQYPDNRECDTEITAPVGYRLVLDFEELVLEKEPFCSYDYLEIIEVSAASLQAQKSGIILNNTKSGIARRLCGDWSTKLKLLRYVSTGSKIRLRFVSDYSHHYGGYKARVSMESAMQCADDRLLMFNSSCYLFVSYPEVTWSIAQNICKGMRAQLASVLSAEEERFITTNIRRTAEYRTGAVYWLGGKITENGFGWTDEEEMRYSGWLPGQNPTEQEGLVKPGTDPSLCLGVQWMTSPTPMLPSGLYWKAKKCSSVGGYVCKRHNQVSGSNLNFNRTINGSEGRLTSPNYPGNYYNNLDFYIRIVGPDRTRLIIQFSKLDIEPQLECLYDFVELKSVVRGNGDNFNDAVKWCGNHDTDMERFDFVSETNEAEIKFHSDYSISSGGFSVTWHAVDVSGCPLQTLTAREGVVASPNYPHFLLARLDCAITILAPSGKRVWLEITDYDMDGNHYELGLPSSQERRTSSSEAILELDLGGSSSSFQPFQLSGHLTDGAFVSNSERLLVRLRTADKPVGAGFRATYKTVNGIQEERIIDLKNVTSGAILHLNYPNRPASNVDFIQHLVSPIGNVILLELFHVKFSDNGCQGDEGFIDVMDNYADSNGTSWHLCYDHDNLDLSIISAPLAITSYLNTLHIRQKGGATGIPLNGSLRVQTDPSYKIKLLRQEENVVESCNPNPCQNNGKCVSNGSKRFCQCNGHFTGLFCALTMCELEPCVFGQCNLTSTSYRCHCQTGYTGSTCEKKQKPCEGNPCEGRGDCIERGDTFHCRCHAWWEGQRCERRLMNIPFRPLSERMLHEPFWLGLITVTVVLGVIGLVWCARRHFPEKLEKLLAEETDRSRVPGPSLRASSVREQLSGGVSAAVMVVPSPQPGCQRSLFGRLGIRKPSILSLTSPHGQSASQQTTAAAARTFSLDDLLKPPPRRTPSPRKKRNNSTPTKKNAAEKKQILQQLITPNTQQRSRKMSIGELIQLSERKLQEKADSIDSSVEIKETRLTEPNISSTAQITLTDPKLEKKVTFARLLNKVSAEMSSGSEVELQTMQHKQVTSLRPSSTPPSPLADIRSPNSTSSNQGSDSLSSSDLALPTSSAARMADLLGKKNGKLQMRQKPASADSILAMFRNYSSTSAAASVASSVKISPSTTPTASTPQDEVAGDDDSTTSSIHTPVSFSSGLLDSPPNYRRQSSNSTIEVPVLDALSAHKCNDNGSNFLHPPTILLEVPTISNKCLSPIRELPTPLPTPIPTPLPSPCLTPVLQRSNASSSAEDLGLDFSDDRISVELPCISVGYSDDEEMHGIQDIAIDIHAEDGLIQEEAAVMHQTCSQFKFKFRPPLIAQTAESKNVSSTEDSDNQQSNPPPPLIIPTLTIQQPSPTHNRPPMLGLPGSPPPHRAATQENSYPFTEKPNRRLLKDFDKPTSLDLPCAPPLITVTFNMSEAESDAESLSPAAKTSGSHLGPAPGNVGMCYLSPFSMCSRSDRTASESNLSSSGYSSMASPGPSRCGSNNPLCPSEMEDPGSSGPSPHLHSQLPRRPSPLLKTNSTSSSGNNADNNSNDQRSHCRGRSDSETLSDDPLLESNDEGIGTDHIDEKIEDGELKSAKELELYIGKDLLDNKLTVEMPKLPSCSPQSNILTKCETIEPNKDRLMPPVSVCTLQLPSIVVQSEGSGCDKYISPVSSRSESPLSDRTVGLGRFSPNFYSKQKDLLPFTDSDGLYDFPSSDCAPQNKVSVASTMQQHRKSTGRKREKKPTRTLKSPTKNQIPSVLHHHHLDVPSKDQHYRVQPPRKPSPKRRARNQQVVSSSSSSESLNSAREVVKVSSSSPSPDTIRWSSPTNWPEGPSTRRRSHESSGEDTAEESSSVMIPSGVEETTRQSRKISRLRTISHQIRFLRRLEKSLKRREHLTCPSDSIDSGEEFARVTSPLLQETGPKPEIRKSSSIGKLQTISGNTTTRFKRGKTKKGGDLLIPQEEVTWKKVLASGNGHSD